MNPSPLDGPLLKAVSRSFYLTVRVLPERLRGPIALAYLLARISDTIADTSAVPAPARAQHLAAFAAMIAANDDAGRAELQRDVRPADPGERELITRLDECLDWLRRQSAFERAEIAAVLQKITHGQRLDVERFGDGGAMVALASAVELDEYTYLVAGCVGEFWTRLCCHHFPHYSTLDLAELSRLGANFGCGLQLVNILRDAPSDLRAGRCYLPLDELHAAGVEPATVLSAPAQVRPVFDHWLGQAVQRLEDGRRYVAAVRPARVRIGCFLPWYLGRETLRLLTVHPPLETAARVKVPRSTVRRALWLSLPAAFSNRVLGDYSLDKK